MSGAIPAQTAPYAAEMEAGRKYVRYASEQGTMQPFRDGSHRRPGVATVACRPIRSGAQLYRGGKSMKGGPLCDGSHNAP